ncbi:polysaccharide pyruvyl transferase family protein [Advenella sp. FME57]|uniref:polysaccharide pyruvyl transferase family protein n=1 Tax=Advenella sp. FME57 TaxID=2742604 RepID=UPI00186874E5|nr:polysaccharide pyruvyl transferase family protein [Advenella sp. FME57]
MIADNKVNIREFVLLGGAGAPNYGDELIVHAWIKYFEHRNLNVKLHFYENNAANMSKLHGSGNEIVELIFRQDLVKIAKNVPKKTSFWSQIVRGYRFIERGGFKLYKDIDLTVFERAESVHLHGGGYLNNWDPEKGFYIGFAAALNKHFGTKIIATGIGFGPVETSPSKQRSLFKEIFSRFSWFELRDVDNFRLLSNTLQCDKFIFGLDDCYLLPLNKIIKSRNDNKKRLFLSFLNYNVGSIQESFWNALRTYSEHFDEILFFESYPWEDKNVFNLVESKIPNLRLLPVSETISKGINANKEDVVITGRFHVHFVFARLGCQGFYNKDSRYYDIKHQSILDRGSNFKFVDYSEENFNVNESSQVPLIAANEAILSLQKKQFVDNFYD